MEDKNLKSARELTRSPHLTPSQARQILDEVARSEINTESPMWWTLRGLIICGFDWAKSPQGHDYWNSLYSRLPKGV